ncbi:hypothetical protein BVER_01821 [Candidatus Burkholderia verschuerenii]|uniref:Uncharacterized protein n=1 Tax=Candidatus Burkholderia verschuerenii TaxID=242163 RepID=A0A0L0MJ48_9BURK|nr:hypothetical protein [Candidatus Burkholderia verschuerenii]KND62343.1 hypothetical protein BVER_01821 [Candidatus Burkholderia verschuerenii]
MSIEEHTYDEPFDMTTPEGREAAFADEARRAKTALANCTPLYGEIKKSSKYYGQTKPGALFPVWISCHGEYAVQGGPGGQYRLKDVWIWALDGESKLKTRLN